jgi:hypothetical protein
MPCPQSNNLLLESRLPNCGWRLVKPRSEGSWSGLRCATKGITCCRRPAPCEGPPRRTTLCWTLSSHNPLWTRTVEFDLTLTTSDTRETHEILSCVQSCAFWRSNALANSAWSRLLPTILFPTQYFRILGHMAKKSPMEI